VAVPTVNAAVTNVPPSSGGSVARIVVVPSASPLTGKLTELAPAGRTTVGGMLATRMFRLESEIDVLVACLSESVTV
jgi:hypothetical protein